MITILAIGKKHEPWVGAGIERYQKRLRKPYSLEWVLLPHSVKDGILGAQEESQRILDRLNTADYIVLLDERGTELTSPVLSKRLQSAIESSPKVVLIIGGAYGVNEEVRTRANLVWSLSPLVFPHQLVRLMLTEQIYRAQSIASGEPYHHI